MCIKSGSTPVNVEGSVLLRAIMAWHTNKTLFSFCQEFSQLISPGLIGSSAAKSWGKMLYKIKLSEELCDFA